MILRRCSWCKRWLGIKWYWLKWGVTYGICKKCTERIAQEILDDALGVEMERIELSNMPYFNDRFVSEYPIGGMNDEQSTS